MCSHRSLPGSCQDHTVLRKLHSGGTVEGGLNQSRHSYQPHPSPLLPAETPPGPPSRLRTKLKLRWTWLFMPTMSPLESMGQEDHELEVSLGYMANSSLKAKKQTIKNTSPGWGWLSGYRKLAIEAGILNSNSTRSSLIFTHVLWCAPCPYINTLKRKNTIQTH